MYKTGNTDRKKYDKTANTKQDVLKLCETSWPWFESLWVTRSRWKVPSILRNRVKVKRSSILGDRVKVKRSPILGDRIKVKGSFIMSVCKSVCKQDFSYNHMKAVTQLCRKSLEQDKSWGQMKRQMDRFIAICLVVQLFRPDA